MAGAYARDGDGAVRPLVAGPAGGALPPEPSRSRPAGCARSRGQPGARTRADFPRRGSILAKTPQCSVLPSEKSSQADRAVVDRRRAQPPVLNYASLFPGNLARRVAAISRPRLSPDEHYPSEPRRSVQGWIRLMNKRFVAAQQSAAKRASISCASSARTISKTSRVPSSGPPSRTKPSLCSAFMKSACASQPSWPSRGRASFQVGPRERVTAKSPAMGVWPPDAETRLRDSRMERTDHPWGPMRLVRYNRASMINAKKDSWTSHRRAIREIAIFGLSSGVLITALMLGENRLLGVRHSSEIYALLVAVVFAGVGIWVGLTLIGRKAPIVQEVAMPADPFRPDDERLSELKITPRELEILGLIAEGLSTREIADRLFVSESTVKTHSNRLFEKLGAKRRTQAVQLGKAARLIPYLDSPERSIFA